MGEFDAVVVGAGPNGLAAAAELTRSGRRVLVVEAAEHIGGGTRSSELTLPGFLHDICSAIHPLGVSSPFFRELRLDVEWVHPTIPVSHPVGDGRAGRLSRSLEETSVGFGQDGKTYRRMVGAMVDSADDIIQDFLGPMRLIPKHPVSFGRMAALGALPASALASRFDTAEARGVLAGLAGHAIAPFDKLLTGGVMLLFAVTAHAFGWPMVRGGSQRLAESLAAVTVNGGGTIETGQTVTSLNDLPESEITLLDLMPDAVLRIAGDRIHPRKRRSLARRRHGPGVFKVDWALGGPIPWQDEWSGQAGTVHVGGTWEELAAAEATVHDGAHPDHPFVLVAQQSLFDPTRVSGDGHTAWAYCHVPSGSTIDMTERIESQVERFAPGFRDLILQRHVMAPGDYEEYNANYVGGDIAGGAFGMRKVMQFGTKEPYEMGDGLYLCSAATPPGAGVHGMCGYYAARAALAG